MALIFYGSGDRGSFEHSSRILGPILRWLFPHLSDETLHSLVFMARKCGHLSEYAVLALLLWRALHWGRRNGAAGWRWQEPGLALALAALYAASDEFHQSFVPSRQASIWDVMLDSCGAGLALAALGGGWQASSWWRRRAGKTPPAGGSPRAGG